MQTRVIMSSEPRIRNHRTGDRKSHEAFGKLLHLRRKTAESIDWIEEEFEAEDRL
jgi:hypothetical protein